MFVISFDFLFKKIIYLLCPGKAFHNDIVHYKRITKADALSTQHPPQAQYPYKFTKKTVKLGFKRTDVTVADNGGIMHATVLNNFSKHFS